MCEGINKLEYLEKKINSYSLIERLPVKILFASDNTLRKLKDNHELINDNNLFIDNDITMLGLDKIGNKKGCATVDGLEVSKSKGVLLIEAKDITNALLERLDAIINNSEEELYVEGIVDNRIKEVEKKLNGSVNLLNRLLRPTNKILSNNDDIYVALFIDYKLTDVDEFGLTGDIGLLRQEIDEYSEIITETMIFTNKKLREMESLIREYSILL